MSIKEDIWKWVKEWFKKQRKFIKFVLVIMAFALVTFIFIPSFISKLWNDWKSLLNIICTNDTVKIIEPTITQIDTVKFIVIPTPNGTLEKNKKRRIEATGESRNALDKKMAWKDALKDAKEKLVDRGYSYNYYEIDEKKSSAIETENDGWEASVVIFIYINAKE